MEIEMQQSKLTYLLAVLGLAVILSGTAFAGLKGTYNVFTTASSFGGSLGSARNSADAVQYIGCRDQQTVAYCYGRDAAGVTKSCTTSNPTHLAMIRGWTDSVYVRINFNTAGTCTNILQSVFSQLEPKQP
jgi:hypothetical protein